jgi:hypothetical protein
MEVLKASPGFLQNHKQNHRSDAQYQTIWNLNVLKNEAGEDISARSGPINLGMPLDALPGFMKNTPIETLAQGLIDSINRDDHKNRVEKFLSAQRLGSMARGGGAK